jgi:1-phosphatidylinositol-4-phosphate 5-kinase
MKKMKIMDYSMLIGVHHIPPKGKGIKSDDVGTTGFRFADMRRENMKFRDLLRSSIRDATVAAGHHSAPTLDFKRSERDDEPVMLSSMPTRLTNVGESEASTTSSVDHSGRSVESDSRDDKHFPHLAMYEHGLDDDDDNSYLEGSTKNPLPTVLPEATTSKLEDLEIKKEQTTEQLFWPFHRLYDIHGHRRMIAARCHHCGSNNCSCDGKPDEVAKLYGIELTPFVPPLSDRKDGGLMMDTTGYERPIKFKTATGREHLCEGKIFYMGIIDILQQYNARKRVEARYRRIQGSGWHEASCVHPDVYAERFIQFFDEYSQRHLSDDASLEEGEESVVFSKAEEAKEEVKANT